MSISRKKIHEHEKEQFKKLFQWENAENFSDRMKILEVFLHTERHVTLDELAGLLRDAGYRLDPDFVKDTLKLMCDFSFAQRSRFNNGEIRYEHRHLGMHHDHMICVKCGKIKEFANDELESLQVRIADDNGFHMLQHKMEIYGICRECLESRVQFIPLSSAKPGEKLVIRGLKGGPQLRMRLMAMGLRTGDRIEVITNTGTGQMVIAADYNRYVIGREMAQKVLVQSASAGNH